MEAARLGDCSGGDGREGTESGEESKAWRAFVGRPRWTT